ncbi:MAG: hypothetical protein FD150_1116 [Rhodobacteraceae bacterium]|nr:MAG: hypothetical protein FD150_1116 [Paracoccaceae bacterium]
MRAGIALMTFAGFTGSAAMAQDAVTYSYDGRIGFGYLSERTVGIGGFGFQYKGPVLRADATGRIEFEVLDPLRLGAIARVRWQLGNSSNYDRVRPGGVIAGGSSEFGGTEVDVAVYAGTPMITLSYGDMESAFDLATREVGQGGSLIDGGNAVWMSIGDGAGSAGYRGELGSGPGQAPNFRTLRADITLGDFTLSASKSEATGNFGSAYDSEAAGLTWSRDFGDAAVFAGAGYDKGRDDRFNSLSLGATYNGVNIILSRIHRTPLVIRNAEQAAYEITYIGQSISYDFGPVEVGLARSKQTSPVSTVNLFKGDGRAIWASWDAGENVSVDVEWSESDYSGGGEDTRKASLAVAMSF